MKSNTYENAGVDIARGDRFVDFIKGIKSSAVSSAIGGFSGAFEIDPARYPNPVFMTTTDGVGTKILVARRLERFDTIGIDLVAMCVNDLLVAGADPISFLDYIACGTIDERVLQEVMAGIVRGCELAGCSLSGGETAELPDMYRDGEFDLAGFAVGAADRSSVLPKTEKIRAGDLIMALPSAGIHSNGLSLARKVIPWSERELWSEMLKPTRIYSAEMRALAESGCLLAAAHITGGGLEGNLDRVLPPGLKPSLSFQWRVPEIFSAVQRLGNVSNDEMRRVFNMGVGIAFVIGKQDKKRILNIGAERGFEVLTIGELIGG
ncbi:MAG TPA: phosphoribosylformylglycinamidine cyclo-ligase [Spirochaetia bacterium]|nr:phosphoribosylformylglycinamidine cyclo-ligase [Spirochaetia bacterium]